MALTLVKTAAKLTIGGGALYVTLQQGIWSSSDQGSQALSRVRAHVLPGANKYFSQVPTNNDIKEKAASSWNTGVQGAFNGLAAAPDMATIYGKKATDYGIMQLKQARESLRDK